MLSRYHNHRRVHTLRGTLDMRLQIRRCTNRTCQRFKKPHRPEMETRLALPYGKFGFDVIAAVRNMRDFLGVRPPDIRDNLLERGIPISARTILNLVDLARKLAEYSIRNNEPVLERLSAQRCAVLDLFQVWPSDGANPYQLIIRDFISGHILGCQHAPGLHTYPVLKLLARIRDTLRVPICALVSDEQSLMDEAGLAFPMDVDPDERSCHIPFTTASHRQQPYSRLLSELVRGAAARSTAD